MGKTLVTILGTIVGTVLAVNVASAVSPSIQEAISGLPLGDQITFVAGELDRVKSVNEMEEVCRNTDLLSEFPTDYPYIRNKGFTQQEMLAWMSVDPTTHSEYPAAINFLKNRIGQYNSAKLECDSLRNQLGF